MIGRGSGKVSNAPNVAVRPSGTRNQLTHEPAASRTHLMVRMRAATNPMHFAWAAGLALLLSLRCLAPAGFMPAFVHGAVTIIPCPDAQGAAARMMHHGQHPGHSIPHQPCPYAAASSLGALGGDWALLPVPILFAPALLSGRTFRFMDRHASRERPPAIGPPIPA